MRQLEIGVRESARPFSTSLDAAPGADIQATVPPLPPEVRAVQWDYIEMIHFLEHLYVWDARKLLKECYEVLAPGGRLVIECPDIRYCAFVLIGQSAPPAGAAPGQFDMWGLYGNPEYEDPLYIHRWGWTRATLRDELIRAGFDDGQMVHPRAQYHHPGRDFRIEAVK